MNLRKIKKDFNEFSNKIIDEKYNEFIEKYNDDYKNLDDLEERALEEVNDMLYDATKYLEDL